LDCDKFISECRERFHQLKSAIEFGLNKLDFRVEATVAQSKEYGKKNALKLKDDEAFERLVSYLAEKAAKARKGGTKAPEVTVCFKTDNWMTIKKAVCDSASAITQFLICFHRL